MIWGAVFLLGALLGLGAAPWDLWYVALPALFILNLIWISRAHSRGFAFGFFAALGYFAVSLSWIIEPFLVDVATHGWMAPFALIGMASGLAIFWGGATRVFRAGWGFAFGIACAEVLRSYVFGGFPWGLVGQIWFETPVIQVTSWIGPYALTGVTALMGYIGARVFVSKGAGVSGLVVLACVAALWSWGTILRQDVTASDILVRVVQPNAEQSKKWDPQYSMTYFQRSLDYTARASAMRDGRPDLVVWPESAIPVLLDYADPLIEDIITFSQDAPVLVGTLRFDGPDITNSVALVTDRAEVVYDKSRLVPFGEFIPFERWLSRMGVTIVSDLFGTGFRAGAGLKAVQVTPDISVVSLICYEAIFPHDVRALDTRPNALVHLTNDAWFGQISGPYQHLAQARMRAIETGLPVIRAANTGISGVLDPNGRMTHQIELNNDGFADFWLPNRTDATVYVRIGDRWYKILLIVLAFTAVISQFRKQVDVNS